MAEAAARLWNSASSSSSSSSNKTVCVMDASGSLGSALVHCLLHRGYHVHAAVDTHVDEVDQYYDRWNWTGEEEEEKKKNLSVFPTDPLDYGSIVDALKGCSALFYSFELPSDHPTYDELMGELEVRAAHNVLEACAQTDTIDKVIFTSSATAIIWRDNHLSVDDVDERNWSDISFCKKFKLWHGLSKTIAEKTAWALAMDRGVNMVSINAGLLMQPDMSIKDPYLLGAAEMYKDGVFVTVDLNFLVNAHICVFEDTSSYGRYLCFNHTINCGKDAVNLANMLLPSSSPEMVEDDIVYQQRIRNDKLNKLMVDFDGGIQVQ